MAGLAVLVAALAGCDPTPVMLRGLVTASQTASPGAGPAPTSIDYPNTGLALIPVEVWSDVSETLVYSTQTDSFGRYEVHESTVPAGTYRVRIGARWWNGASDWATATPVALTNTSITEINTQVSTDISLEGRMLDDAWAPSPGTWVQALDTVGNTVASTITDPATGRFDLSIPTAGIYTLKTLTPPATVAVAVGGTTPTAFAVASGNTVTAGSIDYETGMSMAATPTQVDAGFAHTCALMSDGTIYCWGSNNGGQLGNGTATDTNTPVPVAGITNATSITAGGYHTCATLTDESVVCWGYNGDGQLGNGANINALTPAPVTGIANATSITAGYLHTCATRSDDTIACWGQNTYGQLGNGGNTSTNTPVPVTGITNATSVTAGTDHTCATRSDNTIACWGYTNANSNTPVPVTGITNATSVSGGWSHTCATRSDNTIACWGSSGFGQLGNGTNADSTTPVPVTGISNATRVTAAYSHTCATRSDNTIACWGRNNYGQLGNGANTNSNTPVPVAGINNASTSISSGHGHTCAILTDDTIACWGANGFGQLGDGTDTGSNIPVGVLLP